MGTQWIQDIVEDAHREKQGQEVEFSKACLLAEHQARAAMTKAFELASEFVYFLEEKKLIKNLKMDSFPYRIRVAVNADVIYVNDHRFTFDYCTMGVNSPTRSTIVWLNGMRETIDDNGVIDTCVPNGCSGTERRSYALTPMGIEAFIRKEIYGLEKALVG